MTTNGLKGVNITQRACDIWYGEAKDLCGLAKERKKCQR